MRSVRPWLLLVLATVPHSSDSQEIGLAESITAGDAAAIEAYLESGGDPNGSVGPAPNEQAPLLKIVLFGREQAIALALLRAGADFESLGEGLVAVTREGLDQVLGFLLTQEPDRLKREIAADGGLSLISSPATRGYVDVLQVLLAEAERHGFSWPTGVLSEALAAAISFRQNDAARMLLQYGAEPTGMVLRVAARDGSAGMVQTLLDSGVDPSERLAERSVNPTVNARTAIENAWNRYRNNPSQRDEATLIIRLLLDAGARNEDAVTGEQLVPPDVLRIDERNEPNEQLFFAARFGMVDDAEALIASHRFDASTRSEAARIALASLQNDVARLMIESGAPINDGILHAAARGNSPSMIRFVVSRGADPELAFEGLTPIQHWWERQRQGDIGVGGHYVLHELIMAGAPACWLLDYESNLDGISRMFLRSSAPECWVGDAVD